MNKLLESENITSENISEGNETSVSVDETLIVNNDEVIKKELPEDTKRLNELPVKEPVNEKPEGERPEETASVAEEIKEESGELLTEESIDENLESPESSPDSSGEKALDKAQIVEKLAEIVVLEVNDTVRNEVEALKQAFYKIKKVETDDALQVFMQAGNSEEDFKPELDETEDKLKELLTVFRNKKASLIVQTEKLKEDNLTAKKQIIEQLKELIESKDDFYKVYNEFRKLQQQWKEIKQVPQAAINELWKEYQHYSEKFYDLLKINNEMRDYDFKKNLEMKQALCEAVEKLDNEKDIISAFYQLQKLHQEWREIGPVAKELREDIWSRFKKASSVINKKHQDHFESLRLLEHRNLEEKIALCVEMENVDYSKLTTFKDWDEQNKRVLDYQEKWKTIGFAPKKNNVKVFERFRAACDVFFRQKSEFYKTIKESMDVNLEKKKTLCEKAEALKDSQEWKETTDKFIALQKEWKSIGPVSRKHSDLIWKRFISACDYFFEQKNTHFSSQKSEEVDNLKKKKEIIEKINAIDENLPATDAIAIIRELIAEWNKTGYVPFREKDRIQKEYRKAVDKHFDRLKLDESERRLQTFKSSLSEISSGSEKSKNKLLNERDKLMRTYERLKSDIQTYENNIGFLSVSSKGGGGLMKEMNRKISSLKEELNLIVKKIEVIDENFEK